MGSGACTGKGTSLSVTISSRHIGQFGFTRYALIKHPKQNWCPHGVVQHPVAVRVSIQIGHESDSNAVTGAATDGGTDTWAVGQVRRLCPV